MTTSASAELIKRAAGPVSLWLVGRVLEVPRVKKTLRRVDVNLLRTTVRHRHLLPRRLLRVVVGVGFILSGALMIANSKRVAAA